MYNRYAINGCLVTRDESGETGEFHSRLTTEEVMLGDALGRERNGGRNN